jgi:hypothetical protein
MSHVLPEGVYRPVYDRETRKALHIDSETRRLRETQKGLWQYMFCRDCEVFFAEIETPFLRYWNRPETFPEKFVGPYYTLPDFDYENTKRFLLSVLWRAHVSTRSEWSGVDLGSAHSAAIRALLDSQEPIPEGLYASFGTVLEDTVDGGANRQVVVTPAKTRTDGQTNYVMAFLGVLWRVFVTSQRVEVFQSLKIRPDRSLVLPIAPTNQVAVVMDLVGPGERR